MTFRRYVSCSLIGLAVLVAGCSGGADGGPSTVEVTNQGGDQEGHTPRRFAGSGVGLFAGDDLNPGFPEGEGIHLWLEFELDSSIHSPVSAVVSTEVMEVRGDPFDSLGPLQIEPVRYQSFDASLFDMAPSGPTSDCDRVGESGLSCDVTDAVSDLLADGVDRAQFRIRFLEQSDDDGEQDLALFFLTDSNTNEPGIFSLEVVSENTPGRDD